MVLRTQNGSMAVVPQLCWFVGGRGEREKARRLRRALYQSRAGLARISSAGDGLWDLFSRAGPEAGDGLNRTVEGP